MSEPLSKETFEIYTREHQKYLDSSFEKLAVCVNSVKTSVDQVKTDRDKAWESHAQECAACRTCNDGKIKKLQNPCSIPWMDTCSRLSKQANLWSSSIITGRS